MEENTRAFFDAIAHGNRDEVDLLVQASPDLLEAVNEAGQSGVLTAIYHGEPAIADLLIERGALLDVFEASAAGLVEGVRALIHAVPRRVNEISPDGFQPIGLAAFFGHLPVVVLLLEHGAEINTPSQNQMRVQPINSAAAGGHLEIVRRLLQHGADPNAFSAEGFTPLHAAAQNGQLEMIRLLLEHGADPTTQAQGKSPADFARAGGHAEAASLLAG